MPLSKIQTEILHLLASQRDPESYVAGATPLNREGQVAIAAMDDIQVMEAAGFEVKMLRQMPAIYTAEVTRQGTGTLLEWVADSDFRFFPILRDELFGYVLHPVDLAMNKAMAAAGRRELRDLVDLVTIHEKILPLGAVIWAAVEKSPGFTPEGLIAEIRRNSQYPAAEWRALATAEALDPAGILSRLRRALDEAEAFVLRVPELLVRYSIRSLQIILT